MPITLKSILKGKVTPEKKLYVERLDEFLAKDKEVLTARIQSETAAREAALKQAEAAKSRLDGHGKLLDRVTKLKEMR